MIAWLQDDPIAWDDAVPQLRCRGTEWGGAAEVLVASHSKRQRGGKRETWAGPPIRNEAEGSAAGKYSALARAGRPLRLQTKV